MTSSHEPTPTTINTCGGNRVQNYANVAAYLLNVGFVFGSTSFGLQDNATISSKYQTLVTPSGYAFAIWGVIFIAQLIWTIAQCFPAYRSNELVTKGVGYNYVWVCVSQAVWTIVFGLEKIPLSLPAMVMILIPLVIILMRISNIESESIGRYWLLKFPFEIHAAWIMAATLVNANVVLVAEMASPKFQTIIGWSSLAVLVVLGLYYTLCRKWVIPSVLVWASVAIAKELSEPKESIVATFSEAAIQQTRIAAASGAALLLVTMAVKIGYDRFIKHEESDGHRYQAL